MKNKIVLSEKTNLPVVSLLDIPLYDVASYEFVNTVQYKAAAFISDQTKSSYGYEVKRVRALWDPSLSIPGTDRRGGWRCPTGTRYGGQITDRFGRSCGWGVARRLANAVSDIGERVEGLDDNRRKKRVARRNARMARRLNEGGPVERIAGRVAEGLDGGDDRGVVERAAGRVAERLDGDRQGGARRRRGPLAEAGMQMVGQLLMGEDGMPKPRNNNERQAPQAPAGRGGGKRPGAAQRAPRQQRPAEPAAPSPEPVAPERSTPDMSTVTPEVQPVAPQPNRRPRPAPNAANEDYEDYVKRKFNEYAQGQRLLIAQGKPLRILTRAEWRNFNEANLRAAYDRNAGRRAPSGRSARRATSNNRAVRTTTRRPTPEAVPDAVQPARPAVTSAQPQPDFELKPRPANGNPQENRFDGMDSKKVFEELNDANTWMKKARKYLNGEGPAPRNYEQAPGNAPGLSQERTRARLKELVAETKKMKESLKRRGYDDPEEARLAFGRARRGRVAPARPRTPKEPQRYPIMGPGELDLDGVLTGAKIDYLARIKISGPLANEGIVAGPNGRLVWDAPTEDAFSRADEKILAENLTESHMPVLYGGDIYIVRRDEAARRERAFGGFDGGSLFGYRQPNTFPFSSASEIDALADTDPSANSPASLPPVAVRPINVPLDRHDDILGKLQPENKIRRVPVGNAGIQTLAQAKRFNGPLGDVPDEFIKDVLTHRSKGTEKDSDLAGYVYPGRAFNTLTVSEKRNVENLRAQIVAARLGRELPPEAKELVRKLRMDGVQFFHQKGRSITSPTFYIRLDADQPSGSGYIYKGWDTAYAQRGQHAEMLGLYLATEVGFAANQGRLIDIPNARNPARAEQHVLLELGTNFSATVTRQYDADVVTDARSRLNHYLFNAFMGTIDRHGSNGMHFQDDGALAIDFGRSFVRATDTPLQFFNYARTEFSALDATPWKGYNKKYRELITAGRTAAQAKSAVERELREDMRDLSENLRRALSAPEIDNIGRAVTGVTDHAARIALLRTRLDVLESDALFTKILQAATV